MPIQLSDTYKGPWGYQQAFYLLSRTTFGASPAQVNSSVKLGLEKTIELLFTRSPLPDPPINFEYTKDPFVPIGKSWIRAPYLKNDTDIIIYRMVSLRVWFVDVLLHEKISITEQLTLFWQNHFGISKTAEQKAAYNFNMLVRNYAWGNFKELVKKITLDPAMLEFLNGSDNKKGSPNENYARELLELFTVGKGPLAGPGDYTNFTEQDVREIAKVLTGWDTRGFYTTNPDDNDKDVVGSFFSEETHDSTVKKLSPRLGNSVIANNGADEINFLIDLIFKQENAAIYICRKLYRWFVHPKIDDRIDLEIIAPMARKLSESNYEIQPVLKLLLCSNHFYETISHNPKVKNPYEFTIGMLKQFQVKLPDDYKARYKFNRLIFETCTEMGMEYYGPPNVAGWKAYYQEPLFDNMWINASTLQTRKRFADLVTGKGFETEGYIIKIDPVYFLEATGYPATADMLIEELSTKLFSQPLSVHQKSFLKKLLLTGYTEAEWSGQYKNYIEESKANTGKVHPVGTNILKLLNTITSLPEYNLL